MFLIITKQVEEANEKVNAPMKNLTVITTGYEQRTIYI